MLSPHEQALLRAVIDRILPADDFPSASGFGADRYITQMLDGDAKATAQLVQYGLSGLDRQGFLSADAAQQDHLLKDVQAELWFGRLIELTAEGAYADPGNGGNHNAASWTMIGYDPRLPDGPDGPPRQPDPPAGVYGPSGIIDWDVIIIGSGAGGGNTASAL